VCLSLVILPKKLQRNLTYKYIINNKRNKGALVSLYFYVKNKKEFINSLNKIAMTPMPILHNILL